MLRRLLTPRWLLGLLVTVAAAAGMVRLGQWQLGRGQARHSLQNYAYAIEWVLFAAFAVFCFYKLMSEADRGDEPEGDRPPDVVLRPPPPVDPDPADEELAAYNAYLARLDAEQSG